MFVGYKRLKIQMYNEDGTKRGDLIVIEGKQDKGATTTAEISGLSHDAVTVPGSDINYYIARQGVGEVKAALGVLDMEEKVADQLSGFKTDANGISYGGHDTLAPYCAIEMESTIHGQIALVGLFRGTFTRDKVEMKTLDPSKTFTPEAETWNFTTAASISSDENINGEVMQKFTGDVKDDANTITIFEKQLFDEVKDDGAPKAPTTNA